VSTVTFFLFLFTNVLLFERLRPRLTGGDDPDISQIWKHRSLHFLYVLATSCPIVPIFFAFGCTAEWIAAVKSACTNKFHYEVAAKPTTVPNGGHSKVSPGDSSSSYSSSASSCSSSSCD